MSWAIDEASSKLRPTRALFPLRNKLYLGRAQVKTAFLAQLKGAHTSCRIPSIKLIQRVVPLLTTVSSRSALLASFKMARMTRRRHKFPITRTKVDLDALRLFDPAKCLLTLFCRNSTTKTMSLEYSKPECSNNRP